MNLRLRYAHLYFEEDYESFDCMLEEMVVRYEKRITDPILECFVELEHRADNIYHALADSDGLLDTKKILGISDALA